MFFVAIIFLTVSYYDDPVRRKEFFLRIAKERGFDPLVPENWYPLIRSDIVASQKVHSIYKHLFSLLCFIFKYFLAYKK